MKITVEFTPTQLEMVRVALKVLINHDEGGNVVYGAMKAVMKAQEDSKNEKA